MGLPADPRLRSDILGHPRGSVAMFYVNSFLCNLVVGRLGGSLEQIPATRFWLMHAAIVGVSATLLVIVAYFIQPIVATRSRVATDSAALALAP